MLGDRDGVSCLVVGLPCRLFARRSFQGMYWCLQGSPRRDEFRHVEYSPSRAAQCARFELRTAGKIQAVQRNAPDLNYVPPVKFPQSAADAVQILQAQRTAADDIRSVVAAGRLEEAGIKVLNLLPKVTAAGRVVVDHVAQTSPLEGGAKDVQLLQLQSRLDETLVSFGQVDVSIGQGLRGELGVVTVAQLTILGDLKDAMIAFDDFLQQIPS